jgi:hypothetical protein
VAIELEIGKVAEILSGRESKPADDDGNGEMTEEYRKRLTIPNPSLTL